MATRCFVVGRRERGQTVGAVLCSRFSLSWSAVRRLLEQQSVRIGGQVCQNPSRRLNAGERVVFVVPREQPQKADDRQKKAKVPSKPGNGPQLAIRYQDAHVVVVEKPAGLTTMRHASDLADFGRRARRYLPDTLADLLMQQLSFDAGTQRPAVRAVHRLDKDTSGLVVFAKTVEAERHLGKQFRAHQIGRTYQAVVRGQARPARIESLLVDDRGDGRRGSSSQPGVGKLAVTHVRVLEELGDYTLVECELETGRTHQVRIHLAERGTPLCGERIYDRPLHGKPLPDQSKISRIALHAASLTITHPMTGKRLSWTSPLPKDMVDLISRLRRESLQRTRTE